MGINVFYKSNYEIHLLICAFTIKNIDPLP